MNEIHLLIRAFVCVCVCSETLLLRYVVLFSCFLIQNSPSRRLVICALYFVFFCSYY